MISFIILSVIQIIFIPAFSPVCIGIIRKVKAALQNRQGASIFQPYKDIWKLMHKDEVVSKDASWVFLITPFILFSLTLTVGGSIPLFASSVWHIPVSDILAIIYILALGTFFLALAGIDPGSGFGGFGSSREMTITTLAEGGLIFSLLAASLISGTTNAFSISIIHALEDTYSFFPLLLAGIGFFIALLAETTRFPFDNPATHLELTMIHEAMILEYSGKRLALIEWASANKLLIFISLGATLFLPWGTSPELSILPILLSAGIFLTKILLFCLAIAIIESSMAKLRFFRLPDLLFLSFVLSAIAIGLITSI